MPAVSRHMSRQRGKGDITQQLAIIQNAVYSGCCGGHNVYPGKRRCVRVTHQIDFVISRQGLRDGEGLARL